MKSLLIIFLVLVIIFLYYKTRIEKFSTSVNHDDYFKKMNVSNEMFSKFCTKLSLLDKPNEFNILLEKMKTEEYNKNQKIIDNLVDEINSIQKQIINSDITLKNVYKLETHQNAEKQIEIIEKAIENVKNRNSIVAKLI